MKKNPDNFLFIICPNQSQDSFIFQMLHEG